MTFPDDAIMFTLLGLYTGDTLDADDRGLYLACPVVNATPVEWAVPETVLDDLEGRGWVEIAAAGPVLTERGRYWLARWFKRTTRRDLSSVRFTKRATGEWQPIHQGETHGGRQATSV